MGRFPHTEIWYCVAWLSCAPNARRNGSCWVISEIIISRWRLKWLTLPLEPSNGDYYFAPLLKSPKWFTYPTCTIMWKHKELLLSCWSSQLCLTSFSCCSKPWREQLCMFFFFFPPKTRNVKVLIAINKQAMDWDEDTTTRHGAWWIACVRM